MSGSGTVAGVATVATVAGGHALGTLNGNAMRSHPRAREDGNGGHDGTRSSPEEGELSCDGTDLRRRDRRGSVKGTDLTSKVSTASSEKQTPSRPHVHGQRQDPPRQSLRQQSTARIPSAQEIAIQWESSSPTDSYEPLPDRRNGHLPNQVGISSVSVPSKSASSFREYLAKRSQERDRRCEREWAYFYLMRQDRLSERGEDPDGPNFHRLREDWMRDWHERWLDEMARDWRREESRRRDRSKLGRNRLDASTKAASPLQRDRLPLSPGSPSNSKALGQIKAAPEALTFASRSASRAESPSNRSTDSLASSSRDRPKATSPFQFWWEKNGSSSDAPRRPHQPFDDTANGAPVGSAPAASSPLSLMRGSSTKGEQQAGSVPDSTDCAEADAGRCAEVSRLGGSVSSALAGVREGDRIAERSSNHSDRGSPRASRQADARSLAERQEHVSRGNLVAQVSRSKEAQVFPASFRSNSAADVPQAAGSKSTDSRTSNSSKRFAAAPSNENGITDKDRRDSKERAGTARTTTVELDSAVATASCRAQATTENVRAVPSVEPRTASAKAVTADKAPSPGQHHSKSKTPGLSAKPLAREGPSVPPAQHPASTAPAKGPAAKGMKAPASIVKGSQSAARDPNGKDHPSTGRDPSNNGKRASKTNERKADIVPPSSVRPQTVASLQSVPSQAASSQAASSQSASSSSATIQSQKHTAFANTFASLPARPPLPPPRFMPQPAKSTIAITSVEIQNAIGLASKTATTAVQDAPRTESKTPPAAVETMPSAVARRVSAKATTTTSIAAPAVATSDSSAAAKPVTAAASKAIGSAAEVGSARVSVTSSMAGAITANVSVNLSGKATKIPAGPGINVAGTTPKTALTPAVASVTSTAAKVTKAATDASSVPIEAARLGANSMAERTAAAARPAAINRARTTPTSVGGRNPNIVARKSVSETAGAGTAAAVAGATLGTTPGALASASSSFQTGGSETNTSAATFAAGSGSSTANNGMTAATAPTSVNGETASTIPAASASKSPGASVTSSALTVPHLPAGATPALGALIAVTAAFSPWSRSNIQLGLPNPLSPRVQPRKRTPSPPITISSSSESDQDDDTPQGGEGAGASMIVMAGGRRAPIVISSESETETPRTMPRRRSKTPTAGTRAGADVGAINGAASIDSAVAGASKQRQSASADNRAGTVPSADMARVKDLMQKRMGVEAAQSSASSVPQPLSDRAPGTIGESGSKGKGNYTSASRSAQESTDQARDPSAAQQHVEPRPNGRVSGAIGEPTPRIPQSSAAQSLVTADVSKVNGDKNVETSRVKQPEDRERPEQLKKAGEATAIEQRVQAQEVEATPGEQERQAVEKLAGAAGSADPITAQAVAQDPGLDQLSLRKGNDSDGQDSPLSPSPSCALRTFESDSDDSLSSATPSSCSFSSSSDDDEDYVDAEPKDPSSPPKKRGPGRPRKQSCTPPVAVAIATPERLAAPAAAAAAGVTTSGRPLRRVRALSAARNGSASDPAAWILVSARNGTLERKGKRKEDQAEAEDATKLRAKRRNVASTSPAAVTDSAVSAIAASTIKKGVLPNKPASVPLPGNQPAAKMPSAPADPEREPPPAVLGSTSTPISSLSATTPTTNLGKRRRSINERGRVTKRTQAAPPGRAGSGPGLAVTTRREAARSADSKMTERDGQGIDEPDELEDDDDGGGDGTLEDRRDDGVERMPDGRIWSFANNIKAILLELTAKTRPSLCKGCNTQIKPGSYRINLILYGDTHRSTTLPTGERRKWHVPCYESLYAFSNPARWAKFYPSANFLDDTALELVSNWCRVRNGIEPLSREQWEVQLRDHTCQYSLRRDDRDNVRRDSSGRSAQAEANDKWWARRENFVYSSDVHLAQRGQGTLEPSTTLNDVDIEDVRKDASLTSLLDRLEGVPKRFSPANPLRKIMPVATPSPGILKLAGIEEFVRSVDS